MIPTPLQDLIKELSKLPGLGPRSAQRAVLALLQDGGRLHRLQTQLKTVGDAVQTCSTCGNLSLSDPCPVCTDETRDSQLICVVEGVDDLWALERSGFRGRYHVLGGVVSALDGVTPEDLRINSLLKRVAENNITEIILALSASVDGQTTAHLVAQRLRQTKDDLTITSLAKGMPVGANIDYLDEGTLSIALQGRLPLAS